MRQLSVLIGLALLGYGQIASGQIVSKQAEGKVVVVPASDEIIVQGFYDIGKIAATIPASVDILSTDQIERISAVHPAEALNMAAGVNIHRGSGQEHLTAIRSPVLTGGAGAGSFLYLEDGVPLRAAGFANVNGLFEAGTEFAGKLEIFKGPGPATYGSNAVHGLINVQSRPTRPLYADRKSSARILASDDGLVSAMVSTASGPMRVSASLVHDDGFRENSGFDQQKFQIKHDGRFGQWTSQTLASFNNLNQETAGFIQGEQAYKNKALSKTNPNPEAFRDGKSYRLQSRFERPLSGGTLALTPYARRAELRFLRHFVPGQALEKNGHSSVGLQSAYYSDDDTGFNIGLDIEYTKGFVYEFQNNPSRFSFVQGLHYDYGVKAFVGAVYGQKTFNLADNVYLELGTRAEYTAYDYDNEADRGRSGRFIRAGDRKDDFFTLTPKASLITKLGQGKAYIRAARGSRAPQVTDLYSAQINQVPGQAEVETLDSLEAGYKTYPHGPLQFEFAAFAMKKDNFFFRNANGFNVTNGKTNHIGVEGSLTAKLSPWLTLSADGTLAKHSYDFTEIVGSPANNILDGFRIDSAPDTLGTLRLTAKPNPKVMGEIEWRHVGSYFTNPGNTQKYSGHDIFVLRGRYGLSDTLSVFGRVDNLLDRRYADRADFAFGNERYFPGRPRTLFVGLTGEF